MSSYRFCLMKEAALRAASRYTSDCSGLTDLNAAEARANAAIARPFHDVTIYGKQGDGGGGTLLSRCGRGRYLRR